MANRKHLERVLLGINLATGKHGTPDALVLDFYAIGGGYQVDRGGHHLSGARVPAPQMALWLDGYAQAIEDTLKKGQSTPRREP